MNGDRVLYADCTVEYDGRAQSQLERGNYLIIFKGDGSLLIHGGDLAMPRNYMSAGTVCERPASDVLLFRNRKETIAVKLYDVLVDSDLPNWSTAKIKLVRSESELRDKLVADLPAYIPGFNFTSVTAEGATSLGKCDVLAVDDAGRRHIVELKRHRISVSSVVQLRKYIEGLEADGQESLGYVAAPTILDSALKYCAKHGITYIPVQH